MTVLTDWITYGEEGQYSAFIARADNGQAKLPAIVLIQEVWGVDAHIQDITKRIAAEGYAVIAPELYSYQGFKPHYLHPDALLAAKQFMDMNPKPEQKPELIAETLEAIFGKFSRDRFPDIVKQAAAYMKNQYPYSTGEVASVGFCLGGMLSARLACDDSQLKGAIIYYGNAPEASLLTSISCPVLGFYGEQDAKITDLVPAFASQMKEAGKSYEYYIYPEAPHAFFNDTRPSYRAEPAQLSYDRMIQFFSEVFHS